MDLSALMQMFGPMQQQMQQAAAKRADEQVEGTAGGGAVSVVLTGDLQVPKVTIAPAAAAAIDGDASMLEDLIAAAFGDALRRWKERYGATPDEQLSKLMAGSDMSALGSLLGGLGGFGGANQ